MNNFNLGLGKSKAEVDDGRWHARRRLLDDRALARTDSNHGPRAPLFDLNLACVCLISLMRASRADRVGGKAPLVSFASRRSFACACGPLGYAVPRLETSLSCFNRPAHRAVRISICLRGPARSAMGVDLEAKAKASAAMIWVNWWISRSSFSRSIPSFWEVRSGGVRRP